MSDEIFKKIEKSIQSMDASEPTWLKKKHSPEFKVELHGESGPHMLLLHGLFGAVSNWEGVVPYFSQFARVHTISFPLLTAPKVDVTVKSLAAFVEYYVRINNLEKVVLCGNSLGGHVAMRLCLAAPELVDCMILAAPSGLYEHTVEALPIRPDRRFVSDQMSRVFYNKDFINEKAIQEISQIISRRLNHLSIINVARSAKKDNLLKVLPNILAPSLLLWGQNDEVTTMDVAEQFHKNIPNSQLIVKDKCGHAPMIEYPEWFATEVEKFLRAKSLFYCNK